MQQSKLKMEVLMSPILLKIQTVYLFNQKHICIQPFFSIDNHQGPKAQKVNSFLMAHDLVEFLRNRQIPSHPVNRENAISEWKYIKNNLIQER